MDAIATDALRFTYPDGRRVLDGLTLRVREGETAVLCGLSGSGKTTLLRILCGIIPHALHGVVEGEVRLFGKSVSGRSIAELSDVAGYAFQDADDQLVCTTVEDELAFGLENRCVPPEEIRLRVEEALQKWGLEALRLEDPGRLSGGQKRLVALASLLITGPRLLLLDEPMSHLDAEGRQLMARTYRTLRAEGCTLLIVEHDLTGLKDADRWLLLADGRVAADGAPQDVMQGAAYWGERGIALGR